MSKNLLNQFDIDVLEEIDADEHFNNSKKYQYKNKRFDDGTSPKHVNKKRNKKRKAKF